MRTHKNTHTHAPNVKTNSNGRRALTPTPHKFSIRPGARYPIGATSPWTQEVFPFPPRVETGRLPQHLNLGWASLGCCLNLSDPGPNPDPSPQRPHPHLERGPCTKRGLHGPN
ncbi:hypothetical protein ATANTOWER_029387 [Ataeniobius toweri]|uniref:Uncharacterized protein n=1 Tax=Ataeniobius toweri TaxID=208326 RepID=A0ABU7BK39_9TELE|nr:hypothetical protein [Ataeniobius toweri]